MKNREQYKRLIKFIASAFLIAIQTGIFYLVWFNFYDLSGAQFFVRCNYVIVAQYALLFFCFNKLYGGFKIGYLRIFEILFSQILAVLCVNAITYLQLCLIGNALLSPVPMAKLFGIQILVAVVLILMYTTLYHKLYAPHNMLLIFGSRNSVGLKFKMDSRKDKYNITGLISADEGYEAIIHKIPKYDAVILNDVAAPLRNDILKFCYRYRVRTYVAPKLTDIMIRGAKIISLFDTPLLLVKGTGLTPAQRVGKRLMDIVLCSIAMIVAAPVMAVVAVAIKLEDGGPVFFKQKRMTRGGREFDILKFRSMIVDAEKYAGAVLATDNDPRITKVGKVIRATRLDEIPQILNILKGDMSIVGPRPERKVIADEYYKEIPEFAYRLKVRGGLTGYAQIYGKYNTSAYDKLRLDLMYIENYSLLMDIKLIILTLRIIFSKESTEGIDKQQENQRKIEELLREMEEE